MARCGFINPIDPKAFEVVNNRLKTWIPAFAGMTV
jgi:hypothetical protein